MAAMLEHRSNEESFGMKMDFMSRRSEKLFLPSNMAAMQTLYWYIDITSKHLNFVVQEIQEEMKKHGHEPVKFLDVKVCSAICERFLKTKSM